MELTILELNLPDAEFNAPFAGRTWPAADDEAADEDQASIGGSSVRLGPLVALLALAGLSLLVRSRRGGEAEQATLDEVEA